jgi:hypothetical protein
VGSLSQEAAQFEPDGAKTAVQASVDQTLSVVRAEMDAFGWNMALMERAIETLTFDDFDQCGEIFLSVDKFVLGKIAFPHRIAGYSSVYFSRIFSS